MQCRVARSAAIAAVLAAAIAAISASEALAGAQLHEAHLYGSPQNADTVRVLPEGGRWSGSWVVMNSPGVMYKFSYNLRSNRYLRSLTVANEAGALGFSRGFGRQKSGWGDGAFFVPNSELGEDRARIIGACNAGNKPIDEEHRTTVNLPLRGSVRVQSILGPTATLPVNGTTMVNVICEAKPKPEPEYTIANLEVQADPDDNTCPKDYRLEVTFQRTRLPGELSAEIKFRIVIDGEAGEVITKRMNPRGDRLFQVTHVETLKLDPGTREIKVKVVGGPESETKTRTVTCARMQTNAVTLRYDAGGMACPKLVFETTRLQVTRPGWVEYEIEHESGMIVASKRVEAWREGDGYVAIGMRALRIGAHDARYRAREKGKPEIHSAWERLRITCTAKGSAKTGR